MKMIKSMKIFINQINKNIKNQQLEFNLRENQRYYKMKYKYNQNKNHIYYKDIILNSMSLKKV